MSVTTIDFSRAILRSPYEKKLPDGMGLSLPVPAVYDGNTCACLFVYSVANGLCTPPRGVFYVQYPLLTISAYEETEIGISDRQSIPKLDAAKKSSAIQTLEASLESLIHFFPRRPSSEEEILAARKYHEALCLLTGEAIKLYQAVFPDYFRFVSTLG